MDIGQRNKINVQGSMSSMTDLVFLLLIFFILLSTNAVNGEKVELPATRSTDNYSASNSHALTITSDLIYSVDNDILEKENVEKRLKALFLNVPEGERKVVLRVDKDVPTGETIEMLGMSKVNGWEVVVATKKQR